MKLTTTTISVTEIVFSKNEEVCRNSVDAITVLLDKGYKLVEAKHDGCAIMSTLVFKKEDIK